MTTPRLEVDLGKIRHNTRVVVDRLASKGVSVTGVTKATLGSHEIANAFMASGVSSLGESRVENVLRLRHMGTAAPILLLRSPMLTQVELVVEHTDVSLNTELAVIKQLSVAARRQHKIHGVVLMIELGDLREGIMVRDIGSVVSQMLALSNIRLCGVGANLGCRSGVTPDQAKMDELSFVANSLEERFGINFELVSGGNSASLDWALKASRIGRTNNLRLGEALLLGRNPMNGEVIEELHTDAFTLVAEVIESKVKPSKPWGNTAGQPAFAYPVEASNDASIFQAILAVGHQDTDPNGLCPPDGVRIVGASSDHLIIDSGPKPLSVGSACEFQLNYRALVGAMTSQYVATSFLSE